MNRSILLMVILMASISFTAKSQETDNLLYIEQAVRIAKEYDPWLVSNRHMQEATQSMSVAAGSLPDPQVSLSVANLPLDSFSFNQDAMTQLRVGVSQMFPQGRTLDIKKRQLEIEAEAHPYQRQDRQAKVTVTVSHLWLDAFRAKETIALIEENRSLFEQLTDIATSSYSSAMGGTRQHDIIRAQLELTRLIDRVTMLGQVRDAYQEKLSEWFIGQSLEDGDFTIAGDMPNTLLARPDLSAAGVMVDDEELYNTLDDHPLVLALIQKIDASDAGVDLAKQKYKPAWGLNASYGRRGSNSFGANLPDNVTVGVTLSVPLFTANRQDKEYSAALSRREAVRTEKWQLLRQLKSGFETAHAQLMKLDERKDLYENRLLPQMSEQAEASLTAYTNDDGDFAEVVRARIAELNAKIDALNIDVDRQKTIIQMNYFFTASDAENQMTGDL